MGGLRAQLTGQAHLRSIIGGLVTAAAQGLAASNLTVLRAALPWPKPALA